MSENKVEQTSRRVKVNAERRRPRVRRSGLRNEVRLRPVTVRAASSS